MKKLIFLLAMTLCGGAGYTQQLQKIAGGDGFADRLAEFSARIETISCDFVQTRHVSLIADDVSRAGRFYYRRPGNICLEFKEPAGDMIVMDGRRFKIVSMGKRIVTDMNSNPMLSQMNGMFEACMTGNVKILEQGSEVEYFEGDGIYVVAVMPKNKRSKSYVNRITLTFDRKDMSLSRLRMDEPSGDYTEYAFSGKKFNLSVDGSKFEM